MAVSIASLLMLTSGLVALFLAYEALGNPKKGEKAPGLLKVHRLFGYLFAALFVVIFLGMLSKYRTHGAFDARAVVHSAMALLASALLLVKMLVVRRHKKFFPHLFFVGSLLFAVSLSAVILQAGAHIGGEIREHFESIAGEPGPEDTGAVRIPPDLPPVELSLVTQCGQCHPLGRIFLAVREGRTESAWRETVDRMREKTTTLSREDAERIVQYLSEPTTL